MRNTSKTKQKAFLILPDVPLDAVCSSCIIETEHKRSFFFFFASFYLFWFIFLCLKEGGGVILTSMWKYYKNILVSKFSKELLQNVRDVTCPAYENWQHYISTQKYENKKAVRNTFAKKKMLFKYSKHNE